MKDAKEEDLTPPVNMGESDDAKDVTPPVDAPPSDGMPVPFLPHLEVERRFPPMRDRKSFIKGYCMLYVFIAAHLCLQQQRSANVADPSQLRARQLLRQNPFGEGTSRGPQSSQINNLFAEVTSKGLQSSWPLKARQHNPFGEGTSRGPQSSHVPNDINIGQQSSQTNDPFREGTSRRLQSSRGWPLKARQHNPFGEGTSSGLQSSHAPNDINIGQQSSQTNNPFGEGTNKRLQSSHDWLLKARQHNPFGEGTSSGLQSFHAPNDINIGQQSSQTNNPFGEGTSRRLQSSHGWPLKARQHNPFGEGTSSGLHSSYDFAPYDIDIEMGGTYLSNHVRGWQRLAIIADLLFDVNIQGAVSLVGSSLPVKNVVLYVVLFLYVVGFLAALGGKLFRSSRMGGTGSMATMLAFLITMASVIFYKI